MWIKKLYATFGKLSNETMSLSSGLNVIYGHNESGKSTWTSFIRAMFYGISTREKKKEGFIPDKEKFLPWNGEAMYGKMELSSLNGDITVERTSARGGVLSKVSSKFDDSGLDAPIGDALVGVSGSVYERTAFIRQSGIGVSADDETERRILSIVSSADETISAGEVINRLKKRRRLLQGNAKNGEIPKLEAEREDLLEKISKARETEAEIARISESLEACKKTEAKLSRDALIAKAEEAKGKREYIVTARAEYAAASEKFRETENYPTRRELDLFLQKKNERTKTLLEKEQGEKMSALLREEMSKCEAKLSVSPFANLDGEAAKSAAENDIARLSETKSKKKGILFAIALVFACGFAALAVVLSVFFSIPAVFCVAFALGVLLSNKNRRTKAELSEKYGAIDEEGIRKALSEYEESLESNGKAKEKLSENDELNRNKEITISLIEEDMKKLAEQFLQEEADDLSLAEEKLTALVIASEDAKNAEKEARAKVEALSATADVGEVEVTYDPSEIPSQSASELECERAETAEQIKKFEISLATLKAQASSFSRERAETEAGEISERLSRLNDEYDALSLAIDTIDEAEAELKSRFSPEIEKRTSEIFSYLTGGSYEVVRVKNAAFEMDVASGVATAPREYLNLSQGTVDELYFALRLALFETIVPSEDVPPLILDDAFVNFDDTRMQRALDLLAEKAQKMQIIIFSCHKREAEYLAGKANITEL